MKKENLVPITVRVPRKDIRHLLRAHPEASNQSELIRKLIEQELERIKSWEAHLKMIGTLTSEDIE